MLAFAIFVLLPAACFFAYVIVNFGAEFRRKAHRVGRPGVHRMPARAVSVVSAPRRRWPAAVIVMDAAKKPANGGVA
jgi:hypothetical protein